MQKNIKNTYLGMYLDNIIHYDSVYTPSRTLYLWKAKNLLFFKIYWILFNMFYTFLFLLLFSITSFGTLFNLLEECMCCFLPYTFLCTYSYLCYLFKLLKTNYTFICAKNTMNRVHIEIKYLAKTLIEQVPPLSTSDGET